MYDTARRVALVKKQVRDNTRRRQRRSVCGLSAACMLLFAALVQAEGMAIERGQTAAQGAFGAMLLREDAGGYVLVPLRRLVHCGQRRHGDHHLHHLLRRHHGVCPLDLYRQG